MKPLHISKLILFLSVVLVHITIAQENQQQTQLQTPSHNDDDTSLFREVEDVIDDDSEQDDAYRILKSLQDVTQEDDDDDDQDTVDENDDEQTTEDDDQDTLEEDDDNTIIEQDDDDDEEDEDEEEDDFTPEFPEFQNEETTDFFEHLPQQPMDHAIDNQLKDDTIDDVGEDTDELTQPIAEEEEDDEQEVTKEITTEPAVPSFPIDNSNIPWQRPDLVKADDNSNFYQDIYFKDTDKAKLQPQQGLKIWYIAFIFFVLVIIYRSSFKRRPNGMIELSTSSPAWGKDEKDYLPLHNSNKGNSRHYNYKNEIKNS